MRYNSVGVYLNIRLETGEELIECLRKLHEKENLEGYVVISGLGQLKDPVLAFYDFEKKEYVKKRLEGLFELLAVSGDFAVDEESLVPHIHVVLGDREMNAFGGHLVEGKVGATLELFLIKVSRKLARKKDEKTGLKLLDI